MDQYVSKLKSRIKLLEDHYSRCGLEPALLETTPASLKDSDKQPALEPGRFNPSPASPKVSGEEPVFDPEPVRTGAHPPECEVPIATKIT